MPNNLSLFAKPENQIRRELAGFPSAAVTHVLRLRETRDLALLAPLVAECLSVYRSKAHGGSMPSPDARLREDLGLDSLALTEMVFMFDDLFGVLTEVREVAGIVTFGQLTEFLRGKLAAQEAPCSAGPAF